MKQTYLFRIAICFTAAAGATPSFAVPYSCGAALRYTHTLGTPSDTSLEATLGRALSYVEAPEERTRLADWFDSRCRDVDVIRHWLPWREQMVRWRGVVPNRLTRHTLGRLWGANTSPRTVSWYGKPTPAEPDKQLTAALDAVRAAMSASVVDFPTWLRLPLQSRTKMAEDFYDAAAHSLYAQWKVVQGWRAQHPTVPFPNQGRLGSSAFRGFALGLEWRGRFRFPLLNRIRLTEELFHTLEAREGRDDVASTLAYLRQFARGQFGSAILSDYWAQVPKTVLAVTVAGSLTHDLTRAYVGVPESRIVRPQWESSEDDARRAAEEAKQSQDALRAGVFAETDRLLREGAVTEDERELLNRLRDASEPNQPIPPDALP